MAIYSRRHQRDEYIISLESTVPESVCLQRAGVRPGSYAASLVSRWYEQIFIDSLNLKDDFDRFYKIEYSNFAVYLHKRHLFSCDDIAQIEKEYLRSKVIIHYTQPASFFEDGIGEDLLQAILEPEKCHEN